MSSLKKFLSSLVFGKPSQSIKVEGTKAAKIAKLIQVYGEEIDEVELEGFPDDTQRRIDEMKSLIEGLSVTVGDLSKA